MRSLIDRLLDMLAGAGILALVAAVAIGPGVVTKLLTDRGDPAKQASTKARK